MPRAIWSGSITFGLVNVPVRMYSAVSEQDLHFHWVHVPDSGRIGYVKFCKLEDRPVEDEEITKAYELDDGEIVLLSDEDFEAAAAENARTIEVRDFVPLEEIDPIYLERTYYLGPDRSGESVYALLVQAMEQSGLVALVSYVMRDRENLGCLRVRDGVLTLAKMHFADEIRPSDDVAPSRRKANKREVDLALQLIEGFTGHFEPERYHDTYREALLALIERKRRGEETEHFVEAPEERPPDLMEALRASVEQAKGRSRAGGGDRRRASAPRRTRRAASRKQSRSGGRSR